MLNAVNVCVLALNSDPLIKLVRRLAHYDILELRTD